MNGPLVPRQVLREPLNAEHRSQLNAVRRNTRLPVDLIEEADAANAHALTPASLGRSSYLRLERHRIHSREALARFSLGECDTAHSRKYLRQAVFFRDRGWIISGR